LSEKWLEPERIATAMAGCVSPSPRPDSESGWGEGRGEALRFTIQPNFTGVSADFGDAVLKWRKAALQN
jgi:hypothetical protein